jgi:hypothetical protein
MKVIPEKIINNCGECFYNGEDGCGMDDNIEPMDDGNVHPDCPLKDYRDEILDCPACIKYKPEPTGQLYILPPLGKERCAHKMNCWSDCHPEHCSIFKDTYASAKPVDIDGLAELINKSADEWDKERINLNSKYVGKRFADYIKQAIEEFTKE